MEDMFQVYEAGGREKHRRKGAQKKKKKKLATQFTHTTYTLDKAVTKNTKITWLTSFWFWANFQFLRPHYNSTRFLHNLTRWIPNEIKIK